MPAQQPRSVSATPATRVLTSRGIWFATAAYEHDPAAPSYGLEAAESLQLPPERVFKTLVVELSGPAQHARGAAGDLAVGMVPVNQQLDLKALATAVGGKRVAMAPAARVERVTGYVLGGISPLGQKRALPTVLDAAALDHDTIWVSAGKRGLEIEIKPTDLRDHLGATVGEIGREE